jgi:hypothetical protein
MTMKIEAFTLALLSTVVLATPAWAKHWHEDGGRPNKHWQRDVRDERRAYEHGRDNCYFDPHAVTVIREYYAPQYRSLPPGLAKKFYRTGHLPPGWQKKMEPFPTVVERELIVLPRDYRRGVIDGYAVVYNPRTQVIVDVIAMFGGR